MGQCVGLREVVWRWSGVSVVGSGGRWSGRLGRVVLSTWALVSAFGGEIGSATGVVMADQTARQRARRTALDAQARMRARRAEADKRREALGLAVVSALAERDAVVSGCEARAGAALVAMVEQEGLTLAEAVEWCGGEEMLTAREAARLRQAGQAGTGAAPVVEAAGASAAASSAPASVGGGVDG